MAFNPQTPPEAGHGGASQSSLAVESSAERLDLSSASADTTWLAELSLPRWARPLRVAVLLLTDSVAIVGACAAATASWAVPVRHQPIELYLSLLPLLVVFLLAYANSGLYPGFGLGAVETLRRITLRSSLVFLFLIAASFALKVSDQYSRVTFVLSWALVLFAVPMTRLAVLSLLRRAKWWAEPVVLIGTGRLARRTIRSLSGALALGYAPRCVLSCNGESSSSVAGVPVTGSLDSLEAVAASGVRIAVVAVEENGTDDLLERLQELFTHVVLVNSSVSVEVAKVTNLGVVLGIEFQNQLLRARNRVLKRLLDLVIGSAVLLMAAPLILFCAVLIKLVSPGPAFFRQRRQGLGEKWINVWKLRTMHPEAEKQLHDFLDSNPEARDEWQSQFKLRKDPRIVPRIGTFMRRFSLDELPQLWSVVNGDMSLVGPRPFPEYHLRRFSPEFRSLRCKVRPGLTGVWQVLARQDGDLEVQQTLDTYYIRNWSAWIDLYLLARTILAVLRGQGT